MHIPDDPAAWSQGAAAFKSIFDGLRAAIAMVRDLRGGPQPNQKEGELIDAALDKAAQATAIAEAEVAKGSRLRTVQVRIPTDPDVDRGFHSGWIKERGGGLRVPQM